MTTLRKILLAALLALVPVSVGAQSMGGIDAVSVANPPPSIILSQPSVVTGAWTFSNASPITLTGGPLKLGASGALILSRFAAAKLHLGDADAAVAVAQTLGVQGVVAGTSNTAGADWFIDASQGTGTGKGGDTIFRTAQPGSTGTAQNALSEIFRLSGAANGPATFQNGVTGKSFIATTSTSGYQFGSNGSAGAFTVVSNGIFLATNAAGTGLTRFVLGSNDTNGVSLAKSGAALGIKLGDGSADAALTAASIEVTGSALPTNGMYLASSNVDIATGGVRRAQFSSGSLALDVAFVSGGAQRMPAVASNCTTVPGFEPVAAGSTYGWSSDATPTKLCGVVNGVDVFDVTSSGISTTGTVTIPGVTTAALTSVGTFTSGAGASVGTLTNAPSAGNPTTWIKIIDNGVTRYIPAW